MRRVWLAPLFLLVATYALGDRPPTFGLDASGSDTSSQQTEAGKLLERALGYHDPDSIWTTRPLRFEVAMGHSEWWDRDVKLLIDNARGVFESHMTWKGDVIEVARHGDKWTTRLNGSEQISGADRDHHDLNVEDLNFWPDYFLYLLGLPMKLEDPGTILDPEPIETTFQDQDVLALRVTYDPDIGTDTWYFFLDPRTARLVGVRFFHDEAKSDGDTLVFEGEVSAGRLRLPKSRTWYSNSDGRLRGTDTIRSVEIVER